MTTGSNDDPSMPKGYRDAPPASKGQVATAATTDCDDDPAAKSKKKLKLQSLNSLSNSRDAEPLNTVPASRSSLNHST
jgi:hypothetical protein